MTIETELQSNPTAETSAESGPHTVTSGPTRIRLLVALIFITFVIITASVWRGSGDELVPYTTPPLDSKNTTIHMLIRAGWKEDHVEISSSGARIFLHPRAQLPWLPGALRRSLGLIRAENDALMLQWMIGAEPSRTNGLLMDFNWSNVIVAGSAPEMGTGRWIHGRGGWELIESTKLPLRLNERRFRRTAESIQVR